MEGLHAERICVQGDHEPERMRRFVQVERLVPERPSSRTCSFGPRGRGPHRHTPGSWEGSNFNKARIEAMNLTVSGRGGLSQHARTG